MQPRCKRLSLLLTLCILLSVFTAFPTVSAVSVQPPADAAGAAAVTYEDVLAGLADPYDYFGPLDADSVPEAVGYETALERLHVERPCLILKPNKTVDKNLHIIHICKIMLGFCTVLIGFWSEEGDSLYNVIFKNADGSRTQYLFDYPVKYVTDSGEIEDIRLNVVQDAQTPGAYRTAANSAVTTFSQKLSDGIRLQADGVSLRLIPAGLRPPPRLPSRRRAAGREYGRLYL